MPGGRPKKWKSPKQLQALIDAYFEACDNKKSQVYKDGEVVEISDPEPYTITGLALALDCDRETLLNYQRTEEFFPTIYKAKLRCQNYAEKSLWKPKIATGIIFNLVNNYGWKNKQETENTHLGPDGGPVQHVLVVKKRGPASD